MDLKGSRFSENWKKTSLGNETAKNLNPVHQSFTHFESQKHPPKWDNSSSLDYNIGVKPPIPKSNPPSEPSFLHQHNSIDQIEIPDEQITETIINSTRLQDMDPQAMLRNLSFLEQKIHQLQDLVHLIIGQEGQILSHPDDLITQRQQLVTADLTSIIVQLISTAGSLLPSVTNTLSATNLLFGQLANNTSAVGYSPPSVAIKEASQQNHGGNKVSFHSNKIESMDICGNEQNYVAQSNISISSVEEHELKDDDDLEEGENLPPGSYEILQLEKEEILAPHTHFCLICGKGFKRDANLRMHMRGHGDEYKTPAALAKPYKESSSDPMLIKRYSCPYTGCKRNKDHKKFQPLKTILCVKNHYKRTHCDKSYTCSRCNSKRFSVIADLKTHEKHCGRDKWLCSCGTTFSRKDKLFGHVSLFQGHTPAIPLDESKGSFGGLERGESNEGIIATNGIGGTGFNSNLSTSSESGLQNSMDMKNSVDDPSGYFSPLNFDACNFGAFHEFPRPSFENPENSLSFLLSGSCNYTEKTRGVSRSDTLE